VTQPTITTPQTSDRPVRELHVDFLLEEEFCVNPSFLRKFVEKVGLKHIPGDIVRVQHSVSDGFGEADLEVVYTIEGSNEKVALLIEDKIRAVFQPRQADRYRKRGDNGKPVEWNQYWTCLVAPKSYIQNRPDHGFDAALELEHVKEWLATEPKRHRFKAEVIERAIRKAAKSGVQIVDQVVTAFRASYFGFFNEFIRDTSQHVWTRQPAPTWKGDTWFEIRSDSLPRGTYINHKSPAGFVDLTFPNTNVASLAPAKQFLEQGMKIEQTGNSAAIRLDVPKIERFDNFEEERDRVSQALAAVRTLLALYGRNRDRIEPMTRIGQNSAPEQCDPNCMAQDDA
jgi:hypothetical protein